MEWQILRNCGCSIEFKIWHVEAVFGQETRGREGDRQTKNKQNSDQAAFTPNPAFRVVWRWAFFRYSARVGPNLASLIHSNSTCLHILWHSKSSHGSCTRGIIAPWGFDMVTSPFMTALAAHSSVKSWHIFRASFQMTLKSQEALHYSMAGLPMARELFRTSGRLLCLQSPLRNADGLYPPRGTLVDESSSFGDAAACQDLPQTDGRHRDQTDLQRWWLWLKSEERKSSTKRKVGYERE